LEKLMMRIILDARTITYHFPGIGRYVFNLAQAMRPLLHPGEELVLLRDITQSSPWSLDFLAGEQVQWIDVPLSPFSLQQQWVIPSLLRLLQANLYHSPYYMMPYWPGASTIVTLHDLIPLRYPQYFTPVQRLIFAVTARLAVRTACRVIVVSQATATDLHSFFNLPASRLTIIPEAADPIFCPQPVQTIAILRVRLSLPEQYVLYFGSNKPHKNLVRLVEAWANLQPQSVKLIIAGVWDDRYPQAKIKAAELGLSGSIQFLGPVSEADLPALYSGATAFIFPSEYEGFGLPVLEAMSCGVSVACANTSSLPEVAGNAALLFDPTRVEAMAEALSQLITNADLCADLRGRGLRQAGQFSWQQAAHQTLELYRGTK
jgi:glycosyltransferase involved in cell wall biosynthesis